MKPLDLAQRNAITILMADDDPDDRQLTREALSEVRLKNHFAEVCDGEELLSYLRREGKYAELAGQPLPGIILLDLNMPKMDGREAITEIKSDPNLRRLPIVVLTTSSVQEDIVRTYDLGVSSFITKPVTFDALVTVMQNLTQYWFEIVELPE